MLRAYEDGDPGWECLRCNEIVQSAGRTEIEFEGQSVGSSERGSFESETGRSAVVVPSGDKSE